MAPNRTGVAVVVVVLLLAAGCETASVPTSTTSDVLPPPDRFGPTVPTTATTAPPGTTTTVDDLPYRYTGFLPDGTDFEVDMPDVGLQAHLSVGGIFNYTMVDGQVIPVGAMHYSRTGEGSEPPISLADGVLRLKTGRWVVVVLLSKRVLDDLGPEADAVILSSVNLAEVDGWPVLKLEPPFTWLDAELFPSVTYERFVVAAGCGHLALLCTPTRAVQVISRAELGPGLPGLTEEQWPYVEVSSSAPRPVSDPYYLDPGPLEPRRFADVMWTGDEMIVWGGLRPGVTIFPELHDGAAFDPDTNRWRVLAGPPDEISSTNRAVWADGEMIVVSHTATYGYRPDTDTWRTIAAGATPTEFDPILYHDGTVYVWVRVGEIHALDVAGGTWEELGAPLPLGEALSPWTAAIRVLDDRPVVVTVDGPCSGRSIHVLEEDGWVQTDRLNLSTDKHADCSTANQMASVGGTLVAWEDENRPTLVLDGTSWKVVDSIPLPGVNRPPGPIPIDDQRFLVPGDGEGAIFDVASQEWVHVVFPGDVADGQIVWTGEEFLAWGNFGVPDAWRWAPLDDSVSGGDDVK